LDFHNSAKNAGFTDAMVYFDFEVWKRSIARGVCLVCGDNGICTESELLNIRTTFADDDTTMRVPEWDGVGGRGSHDCLCVGYEGDVFDI